MIEGREVFYPPVLFFSLYLITIPGLAAFENISTAVDLRIRQPFYKITGITIRGSLIRG